MQPHHGSSIDLSAQARGRASPAARRPLWRRGWDYLLQLTSLGIFFGVGTVITLAATVAGPCLARWIDEPRAQRIIQQLFAFFTWWLQTTGLLRIRFTGVEKLADSRGAIFAANHPGLLDAVIILSRMPRAICVIRSSLMEKFAFVGAARLAGYIANDHGTALVRQGIHKVRNGDNLLIFPEGTRTRTEAVNPFKGGFALIALRAGAPIYPIVIERSGRYLAKGTPLLDAAHIPIEISVSVEEPIHPLPGETSDQFAVRIQSWFEERLVNTGEGIYRIAGVKPVS